MLMNRLFADFVGYHTTRKPTSGGCQWQCLGLLAEKKGKKDKKSEIKLIISQY
ncbi:hypothetical protein Hanom_Chr02g00110741 [Helianthus anomalus]